MMGMLYKRYVRLFRLMAITNPNHGMFFVPSVGVVNSEWNFCLEQLKFLRACAITMPDDIAYFNESSKPLLAYLKKKRTKK